MNKYAEIQKIATMYAACRGILRIKLATTAPTDNTQTATTQQPADNTTQQPAGNTNQQQAPQKSGYGGMARDLGSAAYSAITGSADNGFGARTGELVSNVAGKGINAATNWAAKQKGLLGNVGRFVQQNKDKIENVVSGANQFFGGTKAVQDMVNARNLQNQMTAQQQQQENQQFNPDAMFSGLFQNFATAGQNMQQPSQYFGQTYVPNF